MSTVPQLLRDAAQAWPDRPAIIESPRGIERQISFAALQKSADQFAIHLQSKGIRKGDAVLVFVPMSIDLYVILLGLFRLGAVATFLDPSAGVRHINACCQLRPPRAFIGGWKAHALGVLSSGIRAIPIKLISTQQPSGGDESTLPTVTDLQTNDPALITFTSGSTGQPKAAVRSHRFLLAQHHALKSSIRLEAGELDLTTLPIFVLANLASGVTSLLPDANLARPGFVNPDKIGNQIRKYGPTRTGGSPAFYERLAEESELLKGFQKIYTGGAPVFPNLLQKLQKLAPFAKVTAIYGSTEAEPIAEIACSEIAEADWLAMRSGRGLLTGHPVEGIQLRVLKDQWGTPMGNLSAEQFQSVTQAIGRTGEIVVSGNHVLSGYLNGQGDSETKFRVEGTLWHRTGDAGYLDEQGRLWLVGRCSAKIEDAKGTLYPFTAECIAQAFPFVRRSAFVSRQGERLLAVEYRNVPDQTEADQLRQALRQVEVDRLISIKSIPVDSRHNAKVNYPQLLKALDRLL